MSETKTKNVWVYLASYRGASPEPLPAVSRMNAEVFRDADKRNGYTVGPIVRVAVPLPEEQA